jgi:hypothetical protein
MQPLAASPAAMTPHSASSRVPLPTRRDIPLTHPLMTNPHHMNPVLAVIKR